MYIHTSTVETNYNDVLDPAKTNLINTPNTIHTRTVVEVQFSSRVHGGPQVDYMVRRIIRCHTDVIGYIAMRKPILTWSARYKGVRPHCTAVA